MRTINVTQSILDEKPDPNDPCGCAIHEAIYQQLGCGSHVHYHEIRINGEFFETSAGLVEWQRDFCEGYVEEEWRSYDEDDWSECFAEPITIHFDDGVAWIEGEDEEYHGE